MTSTSTGAKIFLVAKHRDELEFTVPARSRILRLEEAKRKSRELTSCAEGLSDAMIDPRCDFGDQVTRQHKGIGANNV